MYKTYFGELHDHNSVGYASGSLEKSVDIATSTLDFWAFTGHAHHHDSPGPDEDPRYQIWEQGFQKLKDNWERLQNLVDDLNKSGEFVAFLGYEWHSSKYGDRCVIYSKDYEPLYLPDDLPPLVEHAREHNALLLPHHPGYKEGFRGVNWDYVSEDVSPVVEIFSSHGASEIDNGPSPLLMGMGPRTTKTVYRTALSKGLHLGIIAGTDDHRAHPGAYNEGLTGVLAPRLDRSEIFKALKNRRTFGITGDRMKIRFRVNDAIIGQEIKENNSREPVINVDVEGEDSIDRIEVIRNGAVYTRIYPERFDREKALISDKPGRYKIRVSWGWGSMGDNGVIDWCGDIKIKNGEFINANGYFRSAPFTEEKRNKVEIKSNKLVEWKSFTSRKGNAEAVSPDNEDNSKEGVLDKANHSLVLDIKGTSDTILDFNVSGRNERKFRYNLSELIWRNKVEFMRGYLTEAFKVDRAIPEESFTINKQIDLSKVKFSPTYEDSIWKPEDDVESDYYYIRVVQANGQMGWASPVWIKRG